MEMSEKNITFEIKEHLGVITRFESGWNRELNIISWNGAAAKYDLAIGILIMNACVRALPFMLQKCESWWICI